MKTSYIKTALVLPALIIAGLILSGACATAPAEELPSPTAQTQPEEVQILPTAPTLSADEDALETSVDGKTELYIASVVNQYETGMTYIINDFNESSDEYRLVIKDYSDGGELDFEAALTRLNVDIGSGNCPDLILFTGGLSPYTFYRRSYLADLLPYLDTDGGISREDLSVLEPFLIDGRLYYISQGFNLETGVGDYSVFGERYGWTLSEYFELEAAMPDGCEMLYNITAESFIEYISERYLRTAIDWDSGICDFDNDTFISILEAGMRIQENPEPTDPNSMDFTYGPVRVAEGTLVMALTWVDNVGKLAFEEMMAGRDLSYIGWPTVDGSCGSDIYPYKTVAAFSTSAHIEGCWEFIEFMLLNYPMDGSNRYMPMYRPMLEQQLENAKTVAPDGGAVMDEGDVEQFWALLDEVENVALYDETVLGIIAEEAAVFLAGDCDAAKAAESVQSRVSLYIGEQS